jgi:hypothetical protein
MGEDRWSAASLRIFSDSEFDPEEITRTLGSGPHSPTRRVSLVGTVRLGFFVAILNKRTIWPNTWRQFWISWNRA